MARCGIWLLPIFLFILLLRVDKVRQTTSSILVESRLEQRQKVGERQTQWLWEPERTVSSGNGRPSHIAGKGSLWSSSLHPTPRTPQLGLCQSPIFTLPSRLLCPQISPDPEILLLQAGCCVRETRDNYLRGLCRGECGPPYVIGNEVGYARELDWKCRRKWLYDSNSKMFDAGQTAQRLLLERSSHRTQWFLILSS